VNQKRSEMLAKRFDLVDFIANKQKETKLFFIVFYVVGILGMLIPATYSLFLKLIPFALILSFAGLAMFHPNKWDKKSLAIFFGIFFIGYLIEVVGVNTGLIFGNYQYGNSLGFSILNTPLIIGLNWLFLIYATSSVLEKFKINNLVKISLASVMMVLYDIVLEQVAPKIDMWYWKENHIPLQNYLAWFIVSFFFHSIIKAFKIQTQNKLALLILICQFLFFLFLYIFIS